MLKDLPTKYRNISSFTSIQYSGTHFPQPHKTKITQSGFTLLEIMIVVVIISVISSFIVVSLQGRDKSIQFENEAKRFTRVMALAREEAILNSDILGVRFRKNCYSFMLRKNNEWKAYNDRLYGPHEIPMGIEFELFVNNIATILPDEQSPKEPQLYILSSGEISPFQLNIKSKFIQSVYTIIGDEIGNLELALKN